NPIDAFVLQQLEPHGLSLAPAAPKLVLMRRAYFDLIGLPPSPDEIASYAADDPTPVFLLTRGDPGSPTVRAQPGAPTLFDRVIEPYVLPEQIDRRVTSGRRLALARWLTQPHHPLTSRVMANRLWQGH